jgi:hypothetical protein
MPLKIVRLKISIERSSVPSIEKIGEVGLDVNDVFHYLFDFGDDWWHRLRVRSMGEGAL